jgi:hypothetical protein
MVFEDNRIINKGYRVGAVVMGFLCLFCIGVIFFEDYNDYLKSEEIKSSGQSFYERFEFIDSTTNGFCPSGYSVYNSTSCLKLRSLS